MPDLFTNLPTQPRRPAGYGNAMFLADLAENVPDATMRARFHKGEYPDLNRRFAQGWRKLFGRN